MNSQVVRQPLRRGTVRAVADEHQATGNLACDLRKDLDRIHYALDGPEVGEVHQDRFIGRRKALAGFSAMDFVFDGRVDVAVDEVFDHFDAAGHAEVFEGFLL